jgi:dienelactone hydrolase
MTTQRTIDPYTFFNHRAREHKPTGVFRKPFAPWKRRTLKGVLDTLGDRPKKVAPNAELIVEWQEDGLIKQRWIIDTQPGLSAPLLLYRPADMKRGEKRPAILCCHGHGPDGKDSVMGIASTPARTAKIAVNNYDYGLQMARKGFVTYAIDLLGFGERSSAANPHLHQQAIAGRDECNINYLCATLLGTTPLAINCHDNSAATDFVTRQSFVDEKHLGVMGLSQGGTMTTWMALTDNRFKAIDIICYAGPFYHIAYRAYNVCGSQITPGLFAIVDSPQLQGLIAPRPLLVEYGIHDTCFPIDSAYGLHYQELKKIYAAADAGDKLELDLHPNEHAWGGNKSEAFFRNHLGAKWQNPAR